MGRGDNKRIRKAKFPAIPVNRSPLCGDLLRFISRRVRLQDAHKMAPSRWNGNFIAQQDGSCGYFAAVNSLISFFVLA